MTLKRIFILVLVLVLAAGGYYAYTRVFHGHAGHEKAEKQLYTCPMHPQIVQDGPGDCPICGMKLVPMKKEDKKESKAAEKKTMYRSSMNPSEVSDHPGKDSMGMDMVPFESRKEEESGNAPGLAAVSIPSEKRVTMGMNLEKVTTRTIYKELRSATKIVPDETRQHKVNTKVGGWIEKLYVNQTGQFVRRGQALMTIYSQELLAAQQEYLSAIKAKEKMAGETDSGIAGSMDEIVDAARERLRLFDITDAQIEKIVATKRVERYVTLHSPATGYVIEKMALPGQRIMAKDPLMSIVDLSVVWGEIDIYEADLPHVRVGMPVEITLSYWPGKVFRGKINFLNPFMSPETRTMKARIVIPNPGLTLKPQMYGDAKLRFSAGKRIAVPESAVMRTGTSDYVFIEGKGDLIVPYLVKTGIRSSDGYYEVISGLRGGERVVTAANFLVDSESSLKAAFQSAAGGHQH